MDWFIISVIAGSAIAGILSVPVADKYGIKLAWLAVAVLLPVAATIGAGILLGVEAGNIIAASFAAIGIVMVINTSPSATRGRISSSAAPSK